MILKGRGLCWFRCCEHSRSCPFKTQHPLRVGAASCETSDERRQPTRRLFRATSTLSSINDQHQQSDAFRRGTRDSEDVCGFGERSRNLPTQGESVVRGIEPAGLQLQERERPSSDVDFLSVGRLLHDQSVADIRGCTLRLTVANVALRLTGMQMLLQELIAIQQNGPKNLGFFGTRNMGFLHQNLIEVLSYAMVLTVSLRC